MGLSFRWYLFLEDGEIRRVSQRIAEGLISDRDALPEYSGTRQRAVMVVLENEGGKPEKIIRTEGAWWTFDGSGYIQEGLRDALRDYMDLQSASRRDEKGVVVDLAPELAKSRLDRKYRWSPQKEDLDRLAGDIWPTKGRPKFKGVKAVAPKRPPFTYDAQQALARITEPFFSMSIALDFLKEPSLKGLAFEARARSKDEPDFGSLYAAVADMADRRLEIARRRRSEKGMWYAVVEVLRLDPLDHSSERVFQHHEPCDGRTAAVKAAQRLLVEYADRFTADTSVEVSIVTDLEWVEE